MCVYAFIHVRLFCHVFACQRSSFGVDFDRASCPCVDGCFRRKERVGFAKDEFGAEELGCALSDLERRQD